MRLTLVDGADPRAVLRALRPAIHGAGPAVAINGTPAQEGRDVPAGTALVVTTSGSTGMPKAVVLGRSALTASALATTQRLGEGRWLLALPTTHIAGLQVLVRSVIAATEPAILSGSFSATAFAAAASGMVSSVGGTLVPSYTSLVPAQLSTLVEAAESDPRVARALAGFAAILVGGQSVSPVLRERAAALGATIVRTYGSTETAGGCVYDGEPLAGVSVRVREGELQVSGPTLAEGYLDDPDRTAKAFIREGQTRWYLTGDRGEAGEHVRVTGRLDNVIISGGVNVSLDEVERVVRELPGFSGAIVVPVDDRRWGQGSAVVVARAVAPDELGRVRDVVGAALGAPARPVRIVPVDAVPLLPSGKPDRRAAAAHIESA